MIRQSGARFGSRFRSSPAASRERPRQAVRSGGGRGRIRTFVARKERQIYSLLVLTTHPPVRTGGTEHRRPQYIREVCHEKRHIHEIFAMQETASRNQLGIPLTRKILAELAEGFEPPTL